MGNSESSTTGTGSQDELHDTSPLSFGSRQQSLPQQFSHESYRQQQQQQQQYRPQQNREEQQRTYYDAKPSASLNSRDDHYDMASSHANQGGRYPQHLPYPYNTESNAYYSNQDPANNGPSKPYPSTHVSSQKPTGAARNAPPSEEWAYGNTSKMQQQHAHYSQPYPQYAQQSDVGGPQFSTQDPRQTQQQQKGKSSATAYFTNLSNRIPQWTGVGSPKPQQQQQQQPPTNAVSSSSNSVADFDPRIYAQSAASVAAAAKRGNFFKKPPIQKPDISTPPSSNSVSRTPSSVNVSVMYAAKPSELRSPTPDPMKQQQGGQYYANTMAPPIEAMMNMTVESQYIPVAASSSYNNNKTATQENSMKMYSTNNQQHQFHTPVQHPQPYGAAPTPTGEAVNDDAALWKNAWEDDDDSSVEGEVASSPPPVEVLQYSDMPHSFRPAMDNGHPGVTSVDHISGVITSTRITATPGELLLSSEEDNILSRHADLIIEGGGVAWDTLPESVEKDHEKPSIKMFYPLLRVLGKGSFGKVVLVRKRTGHESGGLYAMKILRKSHLVKRRQIGRTRTERKVLALVDHPFIMKLHFAFQTEDKLYLVLDYCPGGELFFHLSRYRRFPERVARFYSAELVLAIDHLHSKGIIYRDLKPENVLLDADGHVKLGDFGLAKDKIRHPCKGATSMCGTPEYMSPEVLSQLGHGFCVDYWGLGMLVYEMMTGLPPWYTTDRSKLFKRLKSAPLEIPSYFSLASADFVKQLLQRNQYKRLGFNGFEEVKAHVFYQQPPLNFDLLLQRRADAPIRPCEGWKAAESSTPQKEGVLSNYFNNKSVAFSNSLGDEVNGGMSSEILDAATANFDKTFTRMPLETDDATPAELGGSGGAGPEEELNFNTFVGFTFDETNAPPSPSNSFT